MKTFIGIIGIILGIALGLYVGVWLCLAGGIIGLVNAVIALIGGQVLAGLIGWSIVKIMFAGLAGWLSASVIILPSYALIVSDN